MKGIILAGGSGTRLSAENKRAAWVPAGFAHGFLLASEHAPAESERGWNEAPARCMAELRAA